MEYMNEVETATIYDFWCAVWTIGVACGCDCVVDRPRDPVYLNWYIILAAESGTTRKSTAVETASEVGSQVHGPSITDRERVTPGRLHKYFEESREGHLTAPELVTIMGREPYMSGMPGALTDIYDGRTGYLSFLSASTPVWLCTHINTAVIEGGFTSRCLFIVEEQAKRRIAWPDINGGRAQKELVDDLLTLAVQAKGGGKITLNKSAMKIYTDWYNKRTEPADEYYKSLFARSDDHVLRLAACLCINDETFQIQARHLDYAISCINNAIARGGKLFAVDSMENKARLLSVIDKIRSELIKAGMDGIQHALLYRKVTRKVDTNEFKMIMVIMHEAGCVQRFSIKPDIGKPKTVYRGTHALESPGLSSDLLSRI